MIFNHTRRYRENQTLKHFERSGVIKKHPPLSKRGGKGIKTNVDDQVNFENIAIPGYCVNI